MDKLEIPVRKEIVLQKLEAWKQRTYSLKLDVKVANATDDKHLLKNTQAQLKTALGAIEILEEELKELEKEADAVQDK